MMVALFQKLSCFLVKSFFFFRFLRTEIMFGVKIFVTGDKPPKGENAIIVMNHRCRLDWMFYWSVVARYGELKHEKIIMKYELKHAPGAGGLCNKCHNLNNLH